MANPLEVLGGLALIGAGIAAGIFIPGVGQYIGAALFTYGTGLAISGIQGDGERESIGAQIDGTKFNIRSTQADIPVIYGITRVGLKMVDIRIISTADPDTPDADPALIFAGADSNDILVKVGAFCLGSENGNGIQDVDNVHVYPDGINAIVGAGGFSAAPVNTGVLLKYDDHLKYILEDGDDAQNTRTEIDDQLGWGPTQNGAGIAYGAFFFLYDEEVWDHGVPIISAEVTGNRVYDPRTPTGGPASDGYINHSPSGASADNPALCVLDYLTSKRYGAGVPYAARDGGALDFINEQSFIDAANYCDDLVSIPPSGTEKRFTLNGAVPTSRVVGVNLASLLATCRGELVWQGGQYRMVIRQARSAEALELTEDNIIGEIQWARLGSQIPNIIEATFPDKLDGEYIANSVVWPLTDDTTFLDEDNGMENRAEVALPFTAGYQQAIRTIMVMLREARNDVLANIEATQDAFRLQIGEVVNVTHEGPGWVQEQFMVRQVSLTPQGTTILALQQYTAAAYTLDALVAQPSTPTFSLPDPLQAQNTVRFIYERPQAAGIFDNVQKWRREFSYAVGRGVQSVEVNVGSFLEVPTLDSGASMPVTVPSHAYHVDVTPNTTFVDLLKASALFGSLSLIDSTILLDNTNNGVAQNFLAAKANGLELNKWGFQLTRTGDPTGDMTAVVYEDDNSGLPAGVFATSIPIAASLVPTIATTVQFAFANNPLMQDGATYHIAILYSGGTAGDFISVGTDAGGSAFEGTSKILNGSWVENGPEDLKHQGTLIGNTVAVGHFADDDRNKLMSVAYDENEIKLGGGGAITITLTPYSTQGGAHFNSIIRGVAASVTTKNINEYDDVGWRTRETVLRRIAFEGEAFGSPGAGPNDLDLDNAANGFAFPFAHDASLDIGAIGVYLKKTLSPTGNVTGRIYTDTPSETGTVTTADSPAGDTLTDTAALFQTNNVQVGDVVVNTTRDATAQVQSITSETVLVTTGLSNSQPWELGDSYIISGVPNASQGISDTTDVSTLPTSYKTNPPDQLVFSTPVSITAFTIYWFAVEYSGGDATNFISVSAEAVETSAELNGGWVAGTSNKITWRLYDSFDFQHFAHEATPGTNLETDFDPVTGQLKWSLTVVGGLGDLNDLNDVVITSALEGQILRKTATDWVNTGTLVIRDDGSAANPAYAFLTDPDTGMYLVGAGELAFSVSSSLKLSLSGSRIQITEVLRGVDGTGASPAFSFTSENGLGFYRRAAAVVGLGGGDLLPETDSNFDLGSTSVRWANVWTDLINGLVPGAPSFPLLAPDGSAAAPSYSFLNDVDTGMFLQTAGDLRISVASTDVIGFDVNSINALQVIQGVDGSGSVPTYSFTSETGLGMYRPASGVVGFLGSVVIAGANALTLGAAGSGSTRDALKLLSDASRILWGTGTGSVNWKTSVEDTVSDAYQMFSSVGTDDDPAGDTWTERLRLESTGDLTLLSTGDLVMTSGQIQLASGTVSTPALAFASDLDLGLFRQGTNTLGIAANLVHIQQNVANDEMLRMDHNSATGDPFISWYQQGTRRSFIQLVDSGDQFHIAAEYGPIHLAPGTAGSRTERLLVRDATPFVHILGGTESLRLETTVSGDAQLTFYQTSTVRAELTYLDSGDEFRIGTGLGTGLLTFASGVAGADVLHMTITGLNDADQGRLEFHHACVWTPEDPGTDAVDWRSGNLSEFDMTGNRTITLPNTPPDGFVYHLFFNFVSGSGAITWPGSIRWPGSVEPGNPGNGQTLHVAIFVQDGGKLIGSFVMTS